MALFGAGSAGTSIVGFDGGFARHRKKSGQALVCVAINWSTKAQSQANGRLYASEAGVSSYSDRGLVDPQSLLGQTH